VAEAAPDAEILVVTGDPSAASDEDKSRRLSTATRAIANSGVTVLGGFVLPAVDGYEWHRGFDAELGLFDRDRNPRQSVSALIAPAP
jgi:hypothetical protein